MFSSQISPRLPGVHQEVDGWSDSAGPHGCIGHQEAAGGWKAKQTVAGNDSCPTHIIPGVVGYLLLVNAIAFCGWLAVDCRGLTQCKCLFRTALVRTKLNAMVCGMCFKCFGALLNPMG